MTQKTVKFDEDVRNRARVAWCDYDGDGDEARDIDFFSSLFEAEANRQLAAIPEDPSLVSLMCQIQRLRVGQSVEAFGVTLECRGNPLVVGPAFEVGKEYRSNSGNIWSLVKDCVEGSPFAFYGLSDSGRMTSFTSNGRYYANGQVDLDDLIPGAIQDPQTAPEADTVPLPEPAPETPAPTFKLGDYARRRNGVVVGPLEVANNGPFKLRANGDFYKESGMFLWHGEDALDLVEVVPAPCPASPPESPAPELSDEAIALEMQSVFNATPLPLENCWLHAVRKARALLANDEQHTRQLLDNAQNKALEFKARADKAEKVVDQVLAYMRAKISPCSPSDVDYWRGFNHALHAVCEAAGFTITPAVAVPLTVKRRGK